jgi:hypothetical protein
MNQSFGEKYQIHLQDRKSAKQETSVLALVSYWFAREAWRERAASQ